MGWSPNEPDGSDSDPFPVDEFVKKLSSHVKKTETKCNSFTGQSRHCCSGFRSCFASLDSTLSKIRIESATKQNIHRACRRIGEELSKVSSCLNAMRGSCHQNTNKDFIKGLFDSILGNLYLVHTERCRDLPPEPTTLPTTTAGPTTSPPTKETPTIETTETPTIETTETPTIETTETPTVETTDALTTVPATSTVTAELTTTVSPTTQPPTTHPARATTISDIPTTEESQGNSTFLPTTAAGDRVADNSTYGARTLPSSSDDVIISVSAVIGGLLIVAVVISLIIFAKRRKGAENNQEGSDSSTRILWKIFHRSVKEETKPPNNDEIYAEIDDAFMDAVYRYGLDPPPSVRNRVDSTHSITQINACYGEGSDTIIPSSSAHGSTQSINDTYLNENINVNALRKPDDMVTSFQMDQLKGKQIQHKHVSHTNTVLVLPNQKSGFSAGRPVFSKDRDTNTPTNEYAQMSEAYYSEPIYAVPDTGGKVKGQPIAPSKQKTYNSVYVYSNEAMENENDEKEHRKDNTYNSMIHVYQNDSIEQNRNLSRNKWALSKMNEQTQGNVETPSAYEVLKR